MCGVLFCNVKNHELNLQALKHRGPEEEILISDGKYQYGFCRLAIREIIDGKQPYENSNIISVINGELYNLEEIIDLCKQLDNSAKIPKGDMNVLGLYLSLAGGDGLEKVQGMFAGYVYFKQKNIVLFFRDRVGEKPLYYLFKNELFMLLSENRFSEVNNNIEVKQQINLYDLIQGFVKSKLSSEIFECKPGHYYLITLEDMTVTENQYFELPIRPRIFSNSNFDVLEKKIIESVLRQTASDVPLSLMLSSGIDSSLIAVIMRNHGIDFESFTLGFSDVNWDESTLVSKFTSDLGIVNTKVIYSNKELAQMVTSVLKAMDTPIFDTATISLYAITKAISDTYKVALTGDGGDEISMGYELFKWKSFLPIAQLFPSNAAFQFREKLSTVNMETYNSFNMKFSRAFSIAESKKIPPFIGALSPFSGTPLLSILNSKIQKMDRISLEKYYLNYVLPNIYLVKSDRMSMMNSVELRAPFLDSEIINEAFKFSSLSLSLKKRKYLLNRIASNHLPNYLFDRPKKGFSVPFSRIIEHLDEPDWDSNLIKLFGDELHNTWSTARTNQNSAIASWALLVTNHFIKERKYEIEI